jgi:hypothetical protein
MWHVCGGVNVIQSGERGNLEDLSAGVIIIIIIK